MVAAIKQTVTVGHDGVLEVRSPQLQEGMRAEVIVLIDTVDPVTAPASDATLASFIGSAKGCFTSVEEADQFIRSERDEWDR